MRMAQCTLMAYPGPCGSAFIGLVDTGVVWPRLTNIVVQCDGNGIPRGAEWTQLPAVRHVRLFDLQHAHLSRLTPVAVRLLSLVGL